MEDRFKQIFDDPYLVEVGVYDLCKKLYPNYFDCGDITELIKFDEYCLKHINDIQIEIKDVIKEDDNLFIETSIGTFFVANRFYNDKFLESFKNKKMSLYDFAAKVIYQDLTLDFKDVVNKDRDYRDFSSYFYTSLAYQMLPIYSYYKIITGKIDNKSLSKLMNIKRPSLNEIYNFIPIEVIKNNKFYTPIATGSYSYHFINLREKCKFDENKNLTFLVIMNCLDGKSLFEKYNWQVEDKIKLLYEHSKEKRNADIAYIIDNIDGFKKFVKSIINYKPHVISRFIIKEDLLKYYNDEELFDLYKSASSIYKIDYKFGIFENLDIKSRNKSELVTLDNTNKKVHIKYEDYDIYDETSFIFRKNQIDTFEEITNFEDIFILYNETILTLYKKYHKKYLELKKEDEEDTIYNFLSNLLSKDMITHFYLKNIYSSYEMLQIEKILEYVNSEVYLEIKNIKNDMTKYFLNLYKEILVNRDSKEGFINVLIKYNIKKEEFYNFVLDSLFLYRKDKETLINIYRNLFEIPIRIIDILFVVDEMIERNLSLSEILREKKIPRKLFINVYNDLKENNEELYRYIFEKLNSSRKRGFIKLIRFGSLVLSSDINSVEEYNQKFKNSIPYSKLLNSLRNTSVGIELYKKFENFIDFDDSKFSVKDNKLVLRNNKE